MTDQTTVSGSDAGRQDKQPQDHLALSTTQAVQGLDAADGMRAAPVMHDSAVPVWKLQEANNRLMNLRLDLQRLIDGEPTINNFPEVERLKVMLSALGVREGRPMLNIAGNLCEMGELEMDPGGDGFRIERADGSVVTIVGLTREEVRGLELFADVTLSVTASETNRATTPGATA